MDLAQTLLRSIVRSFYPPEQIIIMDAVLLHSALSDDDLAHLMGMQVKALRKTCSKLREDGLISVQSRPETRQGATRPFNRDYYWVDSHRAIDVVKFRLKSMARVVDQKYGQSVEEKKEYKCPRCKAQYTQMEVLDTVGASGFECKQCGHSLEAIAEDGVPSAGHEVQSRLNAQMNPLEDLLRRIDGAEIPETTFETALEKAIPVKRDENVNPAAKTTAVAPTRLPPQTVHGLKTEEKVEITLLDGTARVEAERREAEARAKFREQNQLPSWHTGSTVGMGTEPNGSPTKSMPNGSPIKEEGGESKFDKTAETEEEQKKAEDDALTQFYATMGQEEEDDDDEDDSDEEEDEDEDEPGAKRVKIEEPVAMANGTPAKQESSAEESGDD